MPSSNHSPATSDGRHVRATAQQMLAESVKRTTEALRSTSAASEAEISSALAAASQAFQNHKPVELLEWVARAQGHEQETLAEGVSKLAEAVSSTLSPAPPLIPFAGKLIAPSAFYETYEALHKLGAVLMSPVLFAEDTDAIGVASINPIAATIFSEEVHSIVFSRTGIRPFITVARMDHESWLFLTRKHFGS
jgi:hypothetical protein